MSSKSKELEVKAIEELTYESGKIEPGQTVKLPARSAQAAVADGLAEPVGWEVEKADETKTADTDQKPQGGADGTGTGVDDKTPAGGQDNDTGGQQGGEDDPDAGKDGTEEADQVEAERITKALDAQYETVEELKDAAKERGVEFAWNAGKPKVIENILEQGKAEVLLK